MPGTDLNSPTVGGLLAYGDWLKEKNYQGSNAVEAWKTAIKKVFETVEPEQYESISLDGLDLDEYVGRFKVAAGSAYKAETIDVYARRIRNAIEAHEHYRKHGKPPSFRKPARRAKHGQKSHASAKPAKAADGATDASNGGEAAGSLVRFPFPLRNGQMAELKLPAQLDKADADRLSVFLRALQYDQPPQIPERTGVEEAEAA